MDAALIRANGLFKQFGDNIALNHVDLEIPKGKMYGLLGPNGAGKTTFIRIITQIFEADQGTVFFDGEPLNKSHIYRIGYMPEERGLYKKMKVGEQLIYLARLKNLSREEARRRTGYWMERLNIESWWNKKIEELSKGMQQKIQFVATVMHRPELLILDEPFSGLDPVNTQLIRNEIAELNKNGTTIIFSTHRMEQVEEICEDLLLINKGNKILDGSLSEIRNRFKKDHYSIEYQGEVDLQNLPDAFKLIGHEQHTLTFQLTASQNANDLIRAMLNHGIEIHGVSEILPSLNEIFIEQVGTEAGKIVASV